MRQQVLEGKATMTEIAKQNGVAYQRIQQLIGPLHGKSYKKRREMKQEWVAELVRLGKSDEEIAEELEFSVGYVRLLRLNAGIHRTNRLRKWTRAKVIAKAQEWRTRYGYTPAASDWNPAYLKKHNGLERAERFFESGAPYLNTVRQLFGSWSEMIKESGLPPAAKSRRFTNGLPDRND